MKTKILAVVALAFLLGIPRLAGAVTVCRSLGHPCEGNQDCCENQICVASQPGAAKRCTACPAGQIPCGNACIPACTASDQCHGAGVCDATTGRCTNPPAGDGTSCNDGNACTPTDTCVSGSCTGSNPVVCNASDQCHDAGVCDRSTGSCSDPAKPNDTICNADSNACTIGDSCQNGVCTAGSVPTCQVCNACSGGACQPVATDANCATGCCNGVCCAAGEQCVAGACSAPTPTPTEQAPASTPTETPIPGGSCNTFTCLVDQFCCTADDAARFGCTEGQCTPTGSCNPFTCLVNEFCCTPADAAALGCRQGQCAGCHQPGESCDQDVCCPDGITTCREIGGDPQCCRPLRSPCEQIPGASSPCCQGGCHDGTCCVDDFFKAQNYNLPAGCSANDECCSGYCHLPSGNCCRQQGAQCSGIGPLTFECCSYTGLTCDGSSCIQCRNAGETCVGDSTAGSNTCCLGRSCIDGHCTAGCGPPPQPCQDDSVCCLPGSGESGFGARCYRDAGVCGLCVLAGFQCQADTDCCPNLTCSGGACQ